MKLVIIGNGFDLAHGIPSSFKDFKNYVSRKDYIEKELLGNLFPKKIENDFLLWSDFERTLVNPDPYYLNELSVLTESSSDLLLKNCLDNSFIDWVSDFCYNSVKTLDDNCTFKPYIDVDNIYLSFNYTSTLENIYGINNVLHIHGKLIHKGFECPDEIIYGHNKKNVKNKQISNLYKPVSEIIQRNIDWFKELSHKEIEEVVLIGFSCSNTDFPYLDKINEIIPNKKWIFFYHKESDLSKYKITARKLKLNEPLFLSDKSY